MNKHILILESDRTFANQMVGELNRIGPFTASVVPSVKEACLLLLQQQQDLAFIPMKGGEKILRALRALQPDLRLILVAPAPEYVVPKSFSGQVQGVLIKSLVHVDLPAVMEKAGQEPLFVPETRTIRAQQVDDVQLSIQLALQDVELGQSVKTAVVSEQSQLMGYCGELNESQAAMIAQRVAADWLPPSATRRRLQFMQLPAWAGDLLLYSLEVADSLLLTLVAAPDAPLGRLRLRGEKVAELLAAVMNGRSVTEITPLGATGLLTHRRVTYAIVWRPAAPLPASFHIPLRRALMRLAADNDCVMTHVSVETDLVHLVVVCPMGRDSVWAAYLFKNGSEAIIQQEFEVVGRLWETGFYACESTDPLTEKELNIFLEHDQVGG